MSELVLVAATGLAREVLAMVRATGQYDILGVLDDDDRLAGSTLDGAPVLGTVEDAAHYGQALLLACHESGRSREHTVSRLQAMGIAETRFATAVDASVHCPEGCLIGPGSILFRNVTLTASVVLGSHVVAMPSVTLMHDDDVADYATLEAGVSLGGAVRIERGATLGMNCSVREGLTIGQYATVGMGAAVLSSVPSEETWVGVPARKIGR